MPVHHRLSRRHLLGLAATTGSLVIAGGARSVSAQMGRRTPSQILGPYYPLTKPLDQDADLTTITGKPGQAKGQVLHVMGRVLNLSGQPVAGARIEVWQANTYGRYDHPSDDHSAPLDPNFQGFALLTTDTEGYYRFKTIKPGAYPLGPDLIRPPHIHFEVTGKVNRLITQMYFAGEPLNRKDPFLQSAGASKDSLIVSLRQPPRELEPDSLLVVWDIILQTG